MTDKEKAGEILQTKGSMTFCAKGCGYTEKVKELIAIGLAEGKPKWHDLRKDPNDLPKHSGLYCVQCGEVREYVKEEKSWFTVHFEPCINRTEETYLWCELPKFEEQDR